VVKRRYFSTQTTHLVNKKVHGYEERLMTTHESGKQFSDATDFQRQRDIPGKRSAVSIEGFSFDEAYPGHAAGEDGSLHVPAEGLIGRKTADVVDVLVATDAIPVLEREMKNLVGMTSEEVARKDLLVPALNGFPTEQDLTHYLKGLLNQKVLEAHRAVVAENTAQKATIGHMVEIIRQFSPELLPAIERQLRIELQIQGAPAIEQITDPTEHIPSVNTLDRIFSSGSISKVLNFFGVHRPA
jgi:hypothetical protein